jgi:signal transduction histidine kinase
MRELEQLRRLSARHAEVLQARALDTTERLLTITGALADAVTPEQVIQAVVDQSSAVLDASAAALWLVDSDRAGATLVRSVGCGNAAESKFARVSFDARMRLPILDAIESGQSVWIESVAQLLQRYPHLAGEVTPDRSYMVSCLPMVIEGRTIGVLVMSFDQAPASTLEAQTLVLLVARHCAQALERIRLFEAERLARDRAERAQSEAALLYRLCDAVNGARSLDAVYEIVLDTIEQALQVDRSAVILLDDAGVMRFKAWRQLSPSYRAAVEGHNPWPRNEPNPQSIFVPDVRANAALADYIAVFQQERIVALAFVPLVHHGRLLGKLMLYWPAPRAFDERRAKIARSIADQVSSAIGRRIAQQEKETLIEDLSETVRLNELFTAVLGHDLRNPLGAILTSAQLTLMRSKDPAIARQLNRIISCGGRMTRLIDQLLDFSRIRSGGGIPCDPQNTDLLSLCHEVLDELTTTHPQRKVAFEAHGDPAGRWDPDRLGQVLSNLLGNALRHGEPDSPVSLELLGQSSAEVTLRIVNQGLIPSGLLPILFHPFRRLGRNAEGSQGLGLGLYITQQIVSAHGGTIAVSSEAGEGTIFTVRLPRGIVTGAGDSMATS